MTKKDHIIELLESGVSEVIVREDLEKKLRTGNRLRVKFGIDPTAPDMHLGHLVPLRKLRAFQKLGHTIVFIIGDFTATIGDPSGQSELRKPLTHAQTRKNAQDYLNEAGKILDIKKAEVHYNSHWLEPLGILGMYKLMSYITVQRALERDDFQKRLKQNQDISLLETVYSLLQGYDSVAVRADVEIGGTDQKFNLLMGRRVQRRYDQAQQNIMTLGLIEGTDGVKKMSKSYGNYISLKDTPKDIYGKTMSLPDELIIKYLHALSDCPRSEVEKLAELWDKDRTNFPARDTKMKLAREMVAVCYNEKSAARAEAEFVEIFQRRGQPTDILEKKMPKETYGICELLFTVGLAKSKSEGRRLIQEGGVKLNGERINNPKATVTLEKKSKLLQVGKHKFLNVRSV